MGKISVFMMISLDGYIEGINHDLSWHNVDAEFNNFAAKQLDEAGSLMFGHRTYEMMARFWLSDIGKQADPIVAEKMSSKPKIVVSNNLKKADWQNTVIIKNDFQKEIQKIKDDSKSDFLVLGSNNLCVSLVQTGLLDELRIMINPIVLGSGTSLLSGLSDKLKLKMLSSRVFKSGNLLLTYSVK